MALVCFGLSVLVIEVVGRLWPTNGKSPLNRVVIIDGVSQSRKQKGGSGRPHRAWSCITSATVNNKCNTPFKLKGMRVPVGN
jgi:hypothetical protein